MKCVRVALEATYRFLEAYCSLSPAVSPTVVMEPAGCQQLRSSARSRREQGGRVNKSIKDTLSQAERWRGEGAPGQQSPGLSEAAGCIAERERGRGS